MRSLLVLSLCLITLPLALIASLTTFLSFSVLFLRVSLTYLDLILTWLLQSLRRPSILGVFLFLPIALLRLLTATGLITRDSTKDLTPAESSTVIGKSPRSSRRGSYSEPTLPPTIEAPEPEDDYLFSPIRQSTASRAGSPLENCSHRDPSSVSHPRPVSSSSSTASFSLGKRPMRPMRSRGHSFVGFLEGRRDRGLEGRAAWTMPRSLRGSPGVGHGNGYFNVKRALSHEALNNL